MIYYRKNTDPEMPLPEDFDILFFGENGGRKKSKKTGAVFIIRHNAKKPKV